MALIDPKTPAGTSSWRPSTAIRLGMVAAVVAALAAPVASARAQTPVRVTDLDTRGRSSQPDRLTDAGGTVYFTASGDRGPSLWQTDGTEAGTTRVFIPFGTPLAGIGDLSRRETDLFFVTRRTFDPCCPYDHLWRTNGTELGTSNILVWNAAADDPIPDLAVVGRTVYFNARDRTHGLELWSSDGTREGTRMVADVLPGPESSAPSSMVAYQDGLSFATDGTIWLTDGTAQETVQVATVQGRPSELAVSGDRLYWVVQSGTGGTALWSSDGTAAGTRMVTSTSPGSGSIAELTDVAGRLAFVMDDGTHGRQLWMTDGGPSGAQALTDLDTGGSGRWWLTAAGRHVYLLPDGDVYGHGLWRSDGTPGGTVKVAGIPRPAGVEDDQQPEPRLTAFGEGVFFFASGAGTGPEPWLSDGTAAGTHLVMDIWPGPEGSTHDRALPLVVDGRVYFTAEDPDRGIELWTTDGTPSGTHLVQDILPSGLGAGVTGTAELDGRLVFTRDGGRDRDGSLWQTDGTSTGTIELAPPWTTDPPYAPSVAGGRLYAFHPDEDRHVNRLVTSDGTVGGTRVLGGWVDGDQAWCEPGEPLDGVFLAGCRSDPSTTDDAAPAPSRSGGLLRSDGTDSGTQYLLSFGDTDERHVSMVTDIIRSEGRTYFLTQRLRMPDASWSRPRRVSAALWRTDGTKAGTRKVRSLDLGRGNQIAEVGEAPPQLLVAAPGRIHLFGRDARHGIEPWVSDGTAKGTHLLADINPGPAGSDARYMARLGDLVTFTADDGSRGKELWVSDGTAPGTRLLKDIRWGRNSSRPSGVVAVGDLGFFFADKDCCGRELWVTDGTTEGTQLLMDIAPGHPGSFPAELAPVGDKLYFTANDHVHGRELWVTDGTPAGTRRVADLYPGPTGSGPTQLTSVAGFLYFVADDGVHGRELWRLDT